MEQYVGLDVSLEWSSVCVLDRSGTVLRETKIASAPAPLVAFVRSLDGPVAAVGMEAGPLSQWLHAGLQDAGIAAVLMETRQVKAALSAMPVKTDRRDAWGITQLLRMGWFRPVHCKSLSAQEVRAVLTARKLLQTKMIDIELGLRGVLRGFGLKMGKIGKGRFEARGRELVAGEAMLEQTAEAMLAARTALRREMAALDKKARDLARESAPCRRMMTVSGVGALTALTFASAVDDPTRFHPSKTLGAHFGLTPKTHQSGETDVTGAITRAGDPMVRGLLTEAAQVLLTRTRSFSQLKSWGLRVAQRSPWSRHRFERRWRRFKRAIVAVGRKLATILHRIWVDGTAFRFAGQTPEAA